MFTPRYLEIASTMSPSANVLSPQEALILKKPKLVSQNCPPPTMGHAIR